jgi:Domain of Unknown Function with PDB structure (DUF3857)/Domain of Unknown Function with PDB structure (DUF3858)
MKNFLTLLPNCWQPTALLTTLLFFALRANANTEPYSIATLSPGLCANANAVVRQHSVVLDIKSTAKSVEKIVYAVTILNENGADFANFETHYQGTISLQNFKGTIYDAEGKKVRSIKKSDLKDYSTNFSNYVLFDGSYVKYYEPNYPQYPYTVVYEYELHAKGSLHYSPFEPQASYDIAVEKADFEVSGGANAFRYKADNLPKNTVHNETEGVQSWHFSNLSAIAYEPLVESFSAIAPIILIAPNAFEYDGVRGEMNDWNSFGKWIWQLHNDRDALPEAVVADMTALRKANPDTHILIQKVYEYVQKRSRYVYIGFGIGGFQPIAAQKVHEVGYGDCKALSNYTKALLGAAGIKAYPVIIYAGKDKQPRSFRYTDFASIGQANHEIICVPTASDTVWLECTSTTLPAGFLGDFTDNRRGLLISENGGFLVKTPQYTAADNRIKRNVSVSLSAKGSSEVSTETIYYGTEASEMQHAATQSNEDQVKAFQKKLAQAVALTQYTLSKDKTQNTAMMEQVKWTNSAQAALTGKRIFAPIHLYKPDFGIATGVESNAKPRKSQFVIQRSISFEETTVFTIPDNFKVEALPKNVTETNKFGTYSNTITANANQITVKRTFVLQNGKFAPELYPDFLAFLRLSANNDAAKMVLVAQ